MDNVSSKKKIINYLKKETLNLNIDSLEKLATNYISDELHLSRSLVSLYLNNLYKDDELVKITTRPVYYFHKKTLENKYKFKFECEYLSVVDFAKNINMSKGKDPFRNLIGYSGSLLEAINQMKTAILYPNGLPILLVGERGVGKEEITHISLDYFNNEMFPKENMNLYIVDKTTLAKIREKKESFKGIILIKDIHLLDKGQEKEIIKFIEQHKYNEKTRLILTTNLSDKNSISTELLTNIPIIGNIPTWENRYKSEKISILHQFFKEEEIILDKKIMMSEHIINNFIQRPFSNNLDDVKKIVKSIVANAYSDNIIDSVINIYPYHNNHFIKFDKNNKLEDSLLSLDDLFINTSNKILELWDIIIERLSNEVSYFDIDTHDLFTPSYFNEYTNYIIFEEDYDSDQIKKTEIEIQELLSISSDENHVNYPINFAYLLAKLILIQNHYHTNFLEWEEANYVQIDKVNEKFKNSYSKANDFTNKLIRQLKKYFNSEWFFINQLYVLLNLVEYNKNTVNLKTKAVILCHGYSTANSIADTVNKLLKTEVFEAIDVPINESIENVIEKLNSTLRQYKNYENYLFLVDMGSLESIVKKIITNATVGIINHVSTPMALEIGNELIKGYEPSKILKEYKEKHIVNYEILKSPHKEKAIVFTSDISVEVAQKLRNLFVESLPENIDLKIVVYNQVIKNNNYDLRQYLDQYEVVLLVRPMTLELDYLPSVAIEDIINFDKNDMVFNIFSDYLDLDEMELFRENVLINFSMESLMNKLLILNPYHLVKQVSKAITNLQLNLKKSLSNRTIIGLNIHICFLIEKLVTKGIPTSYAKIESFKMENKEFITILNNSFSELMENYNVEIPISEVAYIFDYIKNDQEVR